MPRMFSSTTYTAPAKAAQSASTLAALEERQKLAVAAAAKAAQSRQIANPWQGAAQLLDVFNQNRAANRAEEQLGAGREELSRLVSGIDPNSGADAATQARIMQLDPEMGGTLMADAWQQARALKQAAVDRANKLADTEDQQAHAREIAQMGIDARADKWTTDPANPDLQINERTGERKSLKSGQTINIGDQAEARKAEAAKLGLTPDDPRYTPFVLTGSMPRENEQQLTAVDKKAIQDADDMVSTNRNAIDALTKAKGLSDQANAGWFAGSRASLANNLPDEMVPDWLSSKESGAATTEFDNLVVSNALASLKTIFGGNPTEGERKILLDLQGASSMPKAVRDRVLDNAIELAQKRLATNSSIAEGLRGNTYYKPGGGPSGATGGASLMREGVTPDGINVEGSLAAARAAIAKGKDPEAVKAKLQAAGIDPGAL